MVIHEQGALASAADNPQVAQSVLGDLLHGFFVLTAWVLGVALVVVVIAVLSGPYRWAVAIRSRVKRTGRSIAGARSGDHRGVVAWVASRAAGLQLAGAAVAGILLLIVPVSWLSFVIIGVLLAAYEIYLQRIKPPPPDAAGGRRAQAAVRAARAETGRARRRGEDAGPVAREAIREREEMRAERAELEADAYRAELTRLRTGTGPDDFRPGHRGAAADPRTALTEP